MIKIMENLLHYMWRNKLFAACKLESASHQKIEIIHPGMAHQDAGPDFKQAILKIDNIIWAGDIEIHVNSSDWHRHKHEEDLKYQSVILHVVYKHDKNIYRNNGEVITTLELRKYIPDELIRKYQQLALSKKSLPCEQQIHKINSLDFTSFLSRLTTERLLRKQEHILEIHKCCHHDWNETIYRLLAENFGFKTNAMAFEQLAKSIPYHTLVRHHTSRTQTYALLFGQAGMLEEELEDDYFKSLKYEYNYLKHKYKLAPISVSCWMLLRLRPQNFPALRIAQLAELIHKQENLFQSITENRDTDYYYNMFDLTPDKYWNRHYHFAKESQPHNTQIGKKTIDLILINTIIPTLFAYSTFCGNSLYQEEALTLLEKIKFENNVVTREYVYAGFPKQNAAFSQAILELQKYYCTPKKCLQCHVGLQIIGKK